MSQYGSDANAKCQPMTPTTRLSDWTPARATALREIAERPHKVGCPRWWPPLDPYPADYDGRDCECIKGHAAAAIAQIEAAERVQEGLRAERDELRKQLHITSLAVPLEEELYGRIDEMLKYLSMEQGYTLSGIARLFVDCQRRMADDWMRIGSESRQKSERLSRADAEAIAVKVFEAWRQSPPFLEIPPFGERERFSHPTGQAFLDALSRAFSGDKIGGAHE